MAMRPTYASLQSQLQTEYAYPEPSVPRGYEEAMPATPRAQEGYIMNIRNRDALQYQIELYNKEAAFFPSRELVKSVVTDMDHFPYTRFYRGNPYSDTPVIMDKEAGFRRKLDCYTPVYVVDEGPFPNVCFEGPCSTTYPCNPQYLKKYSDAEKINLMLNKACVSKMP